MNRLLRGITPAMSQNSLVLFLFLLVTVGRAFGDQADRYVKSGVAKYKKGDMDGALIDYSKAIELRPDDVTAYYDRGMVKPKHG